MKKAIFNWSGGKDSSLALYHALRDERYELSGLLTSFNGANNRVSMHGIHQSLVRQQARQIGMPLHPLMLPENINMEDYDSFMKQALEKQKRAGVHMCLFGDIFLEDLKTYREQQQKKVQMEAVFPLWQQSTERLARQFIDLGFKAVIVSVNGSKMDRSFVGHEYNESFLADLPKEVDPCGEYGEFHTFVYDGPIFDEPISFDRGEVIVKLYEQQEDDTHNFMDDNNRDTEVSYYYQDLIASV